MFERRFPVAGTVSSRWRERTLADHGKFSRRISSTFANFIGELVRGEVDGNFIEGRVHASVSNASHAYSRSWRPDEWREREREREEEWKTNSSEIC